MPIANRNFREAVAPAYLALCLTLGGSAQGIWVNMGLQLLGVAIIAWGAVASNREPLTSGAKQLMVVTMIGLAVVLIQLVPLPPKFWTVLPGRAVVADGYKILGEPLPWLPMTLTPAESLTTIL